MYSNGGYGGQRPLYDNSRPDDYRPVTRHAGGGYGSQGNTGYGNNNLPNLVREQSLSFLDRICRNLDHAMNNGYGENLYGLVERALNREVNETLRFFSSYERAAGNDDPTVVAGVTLAGWLMASVIESSDPRIMQDVAEWARQDWDIICNTASDYEAITGRQRRRAAQPQGRRPVDNYGSAGQQTTLVSPSEPPTRRGEGPKSAVSSLASMFMAAEAEREQVSESRIVHADPTPVSDMEIVDPMRPQKTSSVVDWMSDRDQPVRQREEAPTRPAQYQPVAPASKTAPAVENAFQYGKDPIFNSMYDNMRAAADQRDLAAESETSRPMEGVEFVEAVELPIDGDEVFFQPDYSDLTDTADNDGILEDFDDIQFDPADPKHDALALVNFAARTLVTPELCGGWKFYESDRDGLVDYDRDISPYPMAYDAAHFVKFRFISPNGKLVEFIKAKYAEDSGMEMQDHIEEMLVVRSSGSSINVLEVLQQTERRVPTPTNRKEVKADVAKGIEAKVATADRAAFDTQIRNTTSEVIAKAIKSKLASERNTTIEGFNERRLTPIYLGKEGKDRLEALRHVVVAAATFTGFVTKTAPILEKLPKDFQELYRARLTAHFNNFLRNRMAMDFEIEDFYDDFEAAKEELADQLGENTATDKLNLEFKAFGRFAKVMPRSAERYTDILGADIATEDYVVFVTTMSTVTLPFSSEEGAGVVPDADERFIGVAESRNPHLYKLLSSLLESAKDVFNNPADIVRVITNDDNVYYVDKGAFSVDGDCYIVSHRDRVADLLS